MLSDEDRVSVWGDDDALETVMAAVQHRECNQRRYRLEGRESEQTPGDSAQMPSIELKMLGQGSLACCSPWDHRHDYCNWTTEL